MACAAAGKAEATKNGRDKPGHFETLPQRRQQIVVS
jgi:hypothetical protein